MSVFTIGLLVEFTCQQRLGWVHAPKWRAMVLSGPWPVLLALPML